MTNYDFNEWTRKQLEALPSREKWDKLIECNSVIILPTRKIHDSNFRCMDFVAVKDNIPICRLSGCSDVIHLDGISGNLLTGKVPHPWSIDCLKKSGLLRLFTGQILIAGPSLSSFELKQKE